MADRTSTPEPFMVDGSVPQQAYIRSGVYAGVEIKWTDRRLKARDEYQAAVLEAALETAEETEAMWTGRT